MYNELFFHNGETGQIIVPILRPDNSNSNKWSVSILKRVNIIIKQKHPDIKIFIRTDSGFTNAAFYYLADELSLKCVFDKAGNNVLKKKCEQAVKTTNKLHVENHIKQQHFIIDEYQAKSWHKSQNCHTKIESTGKGLNVRHFISNIDSDNVRAIYFDCYVKTR